MIGYSFFSFSSFFLDTHIIFYIHIPRSSGFKFSFCFQRNLDTSNSACTKPYVEICLHARTRKIQKKLSTCCPYSTCTRSIVLYLNLATYRNLNGNEIYVNLPFQMQSIVLKCIVIPPCLKFIRKVAIVKNIMIHYIKSIQLGPSIARAIAHA